MKKDAAKLAQEQSTHLFLCVLISELTRMYGPVIRTATVIGVLDQAFDVLIPEFGVEKRVHVDQMPTEVNRNALYIRQTITDLCRPLQNTVYDEDVNSLSIYWKKDVDVLRWLAEENNDAHLQRVRDHADQQAKLLESTSGDSKAEKALFEDDEDGEDGTAVARKLDASARLTNQRLKSKDVSTARPLNRRRG